MPDMETIEQLVRDVGHEAALRLMAVFKNDVDKHTQAIRDFLDTGGGAEDLRIHAHSLKGLCRTYGAAYGGEVALELQEACDAGDADTIRAKAQAAIDIIPGEAAAAIAAARELGES